MAIKTVAKNFINYSKTDRSDIYQIKNNVWTSIVNLSLFPSHLLGTEQGEGLISNFMGLLNGTIAGDPNKALTLQFVVIQYPSSFTELVSKYDKQAQTLANSGRNNASNVAWVWHEYLKTIFDRELFQRQGGVAVTVRPTPDMLKKKENQLGQQEAYELLDNTVDRIIRVTEQIRWGPERLQNDDLTAFLSFWAMGEFRHSGDEREKLFEWEVQ